MSTLLEVLVTCDSNNPLWTCSVWDPHTGTSLMTYKGGGISEARTLSFIGTNYITCVERLKPVLHIWPLNSHQTVQGMRFILPGKCKAFTVSQDGSFIVAGIEEKVYLWQTSSGRLITILNRHYQKIVILKFTSDGNYFVSAAEDGMVMVWSLAVVTSHPEVDLVTQSFAGQHDPIYIFSDHSLPVTDLSISKIGMHGRLCTVSIDRSCKIYDLSSGELLLNLVFDVPLSAVTFDILELYVFIGTTEGNIYQCSLTNPPKNRDLLVNYEDDCNLFMSHTKSVTCLSVSLDGDTLMSGANDERVILWHIQSKQPIRTIKHKGSITNAIFTVNYPVIFKQEFSPNIILHNLERTLEKDANDVTEIDILIDKKINFWPKIKEIEFNVPSKELENDFKHQESKFKKEIETLKSINSNLYTIAIEKALEIPLNNTVSNKSKNKRKKKTTK